MISFSKHEICVTAATQGKFFFFSAATVMGFFRCSVLSLNPTPTPFFCYSDFCPSICFFLVVSSIFLFIYYFYFSTK